MTYPCPHLDVSQRSFFFTGAKAVTAAHKASEKRKKNSKERDPPLTTASSHTSSEEFLITQSHLIRNLENQLNIPQDQLLKSGKGGKLPEPTYRLH
ncbi:hypothetical protein MMC15_001645 [Xylographa vitiligo]|nr:hypothetical protein [Xylographa vitiligo]